MCEILYGVGIFIYFYMCIKTLLYYKKTNKVHELGITLVIIIGFVLIYFMPETLKDLLPYLATPLSFQ
ncbi:hypothetical protein COM61_01935 [Bacillus toyonensis]|nr:hypothetical protein COM61_01935 [Bacillus toyonensis]